MLDVTAINRQQTREFYWALNVRYKAVLYDVPYLYHETRTRLLLLLLLFFSFMTDFPFDIQPTHELIHFHL